jgi:hypothetical protein
MSASVFRTNAQGIGALAESFVVPVGEVYRVVSVELHQTPAVAAQGELFTITHDSIDAAVCNTLLYSVDMAGAAAQNILWQPSRDLYLVGLDQLDCAWANASGHAWGLMITMERVP